MVRLRAYGTALERFLAKIQVAPNGCWEWSGCHGKLGYALLSVNKDGHWTTVNAHKFAYENLVGPTPIGKELDHKCRNPGCVNPEHLEPVSHKVNCQRGISGELARIRQLSKDHCCHGHPFDETNTQIRKNGSRRCLICHREEGKRWRNKPGNREKQIVRLKKYRTDLKRK